MSDDNLLSGWVIMAAVSIISVLVFSTVVSFVQVPKMLSEKAYRDLWVFSVILLLGTVLAVLKSLEVEIPNPGDWVAWIYLPVSDFLKEFLK